VNRLHWHRIAAGTFLFRELVIGTFLVSCLLSVMVTAKLGRITYSEPYGSI
jgi:hypothetical protein